jgi:hypothetical protein
MRERKKISKISKLNKCEVCSSREDLQAQRGSNGHIYFLCGQHGRIQEALFRGIMKNFSMLEAEMEGADA